MTSIGASAFRDTNLTTVVIPSSVTSIGDSAFEDTQLTILHTIHLSPGWNMISIPGNPVNTDPQALVGDSQTIILPLYWWNPERFTYTPVSKLQVGQAYWILALSPEGEDITLLIEPLASLSLELKPGWNMIGGLQQSVTMTYGSENPSGSIVPQTLYSWNASMFTYQPQTILE